MTQTRRMIAICLLSIVIAPALAAVGQQNGRAQEAGPDITRDDIQDRLAAVEASTTLSEEARAQALEYYQGAQASLQTAAQNAERAAEFEETIAKAPEMAEAISKQLADPPEPEPIDAEEASVSELETRLAAAETALGTARAALTELESEPERRAERQMNIPNLIADLRGRLQALAGQAETGAPAADSAEVTEAWNLLQRVQRQAIEQEIRALQQEQRSYEARTQLLRLRQDQAARQVAVLDERVQALREALQKRRREEASEDILEVRELIQQASQAPEPISEEAAQIAEATSDYVDRRIGPGGVVRLAEASVGHTEDARELLGNLETDFRALRNRVAAAPKMTTAVGLFLRRQRAQLPDVRFYERRIEERNERVASVEYERLELEDERRALRDIAPLVSQALEELPAGAPAEERARSEQLLTELFTKKRAYLDKLLTAYDNYVGALAELDSAERALVEQVRETSAYIDERVLWIRSSQPLNAEVVQDAWPALLWLADPRHWMEAGQAFYADAQLNPVLYALALLTLLAAGWILRRSKARLREFAAEAGKPSAASIHPTVGALTFTALRIAWLPVLLAFLGWRLYDPAVATDFARAIGGALSACGGVLVTLLALREVTAPHGLGPKHFDWPQAGCGLVRRHTAWLIAVLLPAVIVVAMLEGQELESWKESLGRLVFMAAMAALAVYAHALLRPYEGRSRVLHGVAQQGGRRWPRLWHILAVGAFAALLILSAWGFHYTALRLSWRLWHTLSFGLALLAAGAFAGRWILVARRRLAREQARKRREAKRAQAEAPEAETTEEPSVDLATVDAQTERLIRAVAVFALIVGLWFIWTDVLPALQALDKVTLWEIGGGAEAVEETPPAHGGVAGALNGGGNGAPANGQANGGAEALAAISPVERITLADALFALLVAAMTVVATRNLPGLLEISLLQRLSIGAGERYAITTLVRYVIMVIGVIWTFGAIGIGWDKVQWLVAALSLGLGFGLQEIFANFVSGLIILFERPIRHGDAVTVGGVSGNVTKVRMRATSITDWDNKELIVPNKEFVTGQLVNWTLSTPHLRVVVPVGVAYGSDTELVVATLYEVAHSHPDVLPDPAPRVLFLGFGDSSLNFELRVFAPSITYYLQILHDMHMRIDAAFRKKGIEISFPQRDLHIRSVEAPFRLARPEEDGGREGG